MQPKPLSIKPQDVVLLLKLIAVQERPSAESLRITDIAHELGISQSEVSQGLVRLKNAALVDSSKKQPLCKNAFEFLVHGLKYVFPAQLGPISRGVPTAHSAPSLSGSVVTTENDIYVWPYAQGQSRGQTIIPLYGSVPEAALRDEKFYELLALCEVLRVGRAREKNMAIKILEKIQTEPC